jgi:FKBP-type peptidyl-prolyl cis-trans isomerase FkpA/FKBP-type peptidyl-prolyl cis-trans isomerase FklB
MRRNVLIIVASCLALASCAEAAQQAPKTDEDKALYNLGVMLSRSIQSFNFSAKELEMVKAGLADGAQDKASTDDLEKYVPKLQELQQKRMAEATVKEKAAGAAYLTKAAADKDATKTASGLVIKTLKVGTGASPTAEDQVKVNYEGRFVDGKVFDSSIKRNEPATFPLNGVIPCWTEAVQLLKVGGKAQIVCPPELAYGEEGRPPQMRGGATLVFDIELLEVGKPDPSAAGAPPAPGHP